MSLTTLLIIVVVAILLGGGGFYFGARGSAALVERAPMAGTRRTIVG